MVQETNKMFETRVLYRSWYEDKYDQFLLKLKNSNKDYPFFNSLFPVLEIAALKYFENKQPNLLDRLKWNYHLLFKRDEKYIIKESQSKQYDVIFWPTQPKHYMVQLPVYKQLQKRNITSAFVTNSSAIQDLLKNEGVDYLHVHRIPQKRNRIHKLIQNLKIYNFSKDQGSFDLDGRKIEFSSIIRDTLTYRLTADQSKEIYSEIKLHAKPKILFFGYGFSILALANDEDCKKDGIISASLQMGRMMYYLFKYSRLQVFYAYGKEVKEKIEKIAPNVDVRDVGSLKIEVTGYSPGKEDINSLIVQLREKYKTIGLVAFSGPGLTVSFNGHIESLKALKSAAEKFKDVYFIIKLHPKDKRHYYNEFETIENVLVIDNQHPFFKFDIIHWVKQSDFVMSGASTSLIESAYWMKPVISLDLTGELQDIDLLKEEFILKCQTSEELKFTIQSILDNDPMFLKKMDSMKKYIEYAFRKEEVQPSELVADDVINRLKQDTTATN